MTLNTDAVAYPNFSRIVAEIVRQWPEHEKYLAVNLAEREPALMTHSEMLARIVCALGGDKPGGLESLVRDYRFLCQDIVLPEELYFRRHGKYRLSRFEDALATVYNNKTFMTRYMNGLLVSDVMWINHCRCMKHYAQEFLPSLSDDAQLLEIGPGHGLLLYLACNAPNIAKITAWDVSDASLELAAHTLKTLGAARDVAFVKRNMFESAIMKPENHAKFDGVVFSEVLEHVEDPLGALKVLFHVCKPGGRVWVNVPANSPAPDHLFLVNRPAEAAALVEKAGFEIAATASYPTSGTSLERAEKQKLTVNCVVVGRKPS